MKNGKHKTNSFDSFNSWSKKTNLHPSFQGGAGGRLFPLTKCEARLTKREARAANLLETHGVG